MDRQATHSWECGPHCPRCDYLLIGLPEPRCPECGTPFSWAAVSAAARAPRLPIETSRGWRRLLGALHTWLLVLFRPHAFAQRVAGQASLGLATLFALACLLVGLTAVVWRSSAQFWLLDVLVCSGGVWLHIELQSLLFFLVDFRRVGWWHRWLLWRKISLYTTGFVALQCVTSPPVLYLWHRGNFPWLLDGHTWTWLQSIWPDWNYLWPDVVRGVAFYWWLAVLLIIVTVHLRCRWSLLIILPAMPVILILLCSLLWIVLPPLMK